MIRLVQKDPKSILGNTIRNLRVAYGISQEELAARADLHRTYIGGVERGERNVSLENIVKVARALKVSLARLLDGIE
jgi:transcriptional regulator with XRE-family HTH domain